MKKIIFATLLSLITLSGVLAASVHELHNQEFRDHQKLMKRILPEDMKLCPITGIKDQSMDAEALIDLATYATLTSGQKDVSTFYIYHNGSSNEALQRGELMKLIVTETSVGVEKTRVEVYQLENSVFDKDVRAGKIDFPGYVLKKTFPCQSPVH